MPKVRKFDTGIAPRPASENAVPEISSQAAAQLAARAPVKIRGPGNPRPRRYQQKTYSLLPEDIELIEALVLEIRRAGLYARGRSDVIRAGLRVLSRLSPEDKIKAVEAVEHLRPGR